MPPKQIAYVNLGLGRDVARRLPNAFSERSCTLQYPHVFRSLCVQGSSCGRQNTLSLSRTAFTQFQIRNIPILASKDALQHTEMNLDKWEETAEHYGVWKFSPSAGKSVLILDCYRLSAQSCQVAAILLNLSAEQRSELPPVTPSMVWLA